MEVSASGQICGATIRDVDLRAVDDATVAAIREAWLEYKVVGFPDQALTDDDLVDFAMKFGPLGEDPFFAPIDGNRHVAAIERLPDETSPLFAENWHADWSFQAFPPDATCLYSKVVPPVGGDTLYADQVAALTAMDPALRSRLEGVVAVHSARGGYAPDGSYGDDDVEGRSMRIVPSDAAYATQTHPFIQTHAETGDETLYSVLGYIIDLEGMPTDEARALLYEVYAWQTRDEFVYRHRWEPNMLTMWDNRCLLHRATGGYEGHHRLLHRVTVGYNAAVR